MPVMTVRAGLCGCWATVCASM